MAQRYGLPYQGSKNAIAEWVVGHLPRAETLVDLFCGGCAVTHAALLSGKWEKIIANDMRGDVPKLFADAVAGEYTTISRPEWISRQDFFRLKDVDAYVRLCWSFGNNGEGYLYSQEIEPFKKWLHALIFGQTIPKRMTAWRAFVNEFAKLTAQIEKLSAQTRELCDECNVEIQLRGDGSIDAEKTRRDVMRVKTAEIRQYMRDALKASGHTAADVDKLLGTNGMARHYFSASQWALPTAEAYCKMQSIIPNLNIPWAVLNESLQRLESLQNLQNLQRLQRLQSLESLDRLQSLQRLQGLQISGLDYHDVEIPADAVVYCDIPYTCTSNCYGVQFDHRTFFDWACAQTAPVIISEYSINDDRFVMLAGTQKKQLLQGAKHQKTVMERLYCPKHQREMICAMLEREKDEQQKLAI